MSGRLELVPSDSGVLVRVAARPGAARSAIQGVLGGALKVAVAAPPEKGKANKELTRFLARRLGVRRAQVSLVSGEASRSKTIRIDGLCEAEVRARLADPG
ncbi:MAG: YggU family protein [Planctomycetota bacterium]|nr:MAG: YggU family protein [Planctomycetota bacterium]